MAVLSESSVAEHSRARKVYRPKTPSPFSYLQSHNPPASQDFAWRIRNAPANPWKGKCTTHQVISMPTQKWEIATPHGVKLTLRTPLISNVFQPRFHVPTGSRLRPSHLASPGFCTTSTTSTRSPACRVDVTSFQLQVVETCHETCHETC